MVKVVYNNCYGGFGLSPEATLRLYELGCAEIATPVDEYYPLAERERDPTSILGHAKNLSKWREYLGGKHEGRNIFLTVFSPDERFVLDAGDISRTDPRLLQVIEEIGAEKASGGCASLAIAEVPEGARYRIDEYDGNERVMTPNDYEWQTAR